MAEQPRVVVLRPLGLGDFLTGVPAYRAIARVFADHHIILAAPCVLGPLIDLVGAIGSLHHTPPLVPLDLALHGADVAIDLHGRGPQSHEILLAARPGRLIAFANRAIAQSADGAVWRSDEHEVARWCRMLSHAGVPADARELDLAAPPLRVPPAISGATLIHASAASEARRWPADRWATVARAEAAAGRTVIFTGDLHDVRLANEIADRAGIARTQVYAGRTDLRELAAMVAAAGRVICGDTGVAHLATAYRTPSVVLFGPVSPALWGPPPERPYHRALWAGHEGDPHAPRVDAGLLEISAADVVAALAELAEAGRVAVQATLGPAIAVRR